MELEKKEMKTSGSSNLIDKSSMVDIMSCFDNGFSPRINQENFLKDFEKNYDDFDVFVASMPPGDGKSRIATAIANYAKRNNLGRVAIVTGNVMLQDQYSNDFPWIPSLKGQSRYSCANVPNKSCKSRKASQGEFCPSTYENPCTYLSKISEVKSSHSAIFNYHSLIYGSLGFLKEEREILIIDEAHNTRKIIESMYSLKIFKFEANYPDFTEKGNFNKSKMLDSSEVMSWLTNYSAVLEGEANYARMRGEEKLADQYESIIFAINNISKEASENPDNLLILKKKEFYRKPGEAGKEEEFLYIKPKTVKKLSDLIFKDHFKKIIMMSATISEEDIRAVGLDNKKVNYFTSPGIIPPERQPFVYWPVASMTYNNRTESLPKIMTAIKKLAERHSSEKGVIHATYEVAEFLRKNLTDQRFMFHSNRDKEDVYKRFKSSKSPRILVASGMSEGIDLKDDMARWQVICMVIRPSIADDINFYNMKFNKSLYDWDTLLTIIQQSGRVCRHENDKGVTYMLDSSFENVYRDTTTKRLLSGKKSLAPDSFTNRIIGLK